MLTESPQMFYIYLLIFVVLTIVFFLLPGWIVKPSLRGNIRKDESDENDYNYIKLTKEQAKAFEYIEFNWNVINPVLKLHLKDKVNKVDLTLIYVDIEKQKQIVRHFTLKVDEKDNKREFVLELPTNSNLHSVIVNSIDKKMMCSHGLYVLDSAVVSILSIAQMIVLALLTISMVKAIEVVSLYNGGVNNYYFDLDFIGLEINDTTVLIVAIVVLVILMFPSINDMNRNHYKDEIYGGYIND